MGCPIYTDQLSPSDRYFCPLLTMCPPFIFYLIMLLSRNLIKRQTAQNIFPTSTLFRGMCNFAPHPYLNDSIRISAPIIFFIFIILDIFCKNFGVSSISNSNVIAFFRRRPHCKVKELVNVI